MIKTIVTSLVTALVMSVIVVTVLVGNNQSDSSAGLGARGTRFPDGISADSTSPSVGQVRGTTLSITGATTLTGVLSAPSSGNKIGTNTAKNYTYFGAGDGCAAVYFTSSTTQTVQATSTSFCN